MKSQRYCVFALSLKCVSCGIVGTEMHLQTHLKKDGSHTEESGHFNLYGYNKDGKRVLFTKDHILPKAHGGKDVLSNYNTMCSPCNNIKGSKREEQN